MLQRVAVCCKVYTKMHQRDNLSVSLSVAVLQYAVCCGVLESVAVCCSIAERCSMAITVSHSPLLSHTSQPYAYDNTCSSHNQKCLFLPLILIKWGRSIHTHKHTHNIQCTERKVIWAGTCVERGDMGWLRSVASIKL